MWKIRTLLLLMCFSAIGLAVDHDHHNVTVHKTNIKNDTVHPNNSEAKAQGLDAKQALARLLEGNKRFVDDVFNKTHKDVNRRQQLTQGQNPFAVIVCCSDSRVPPELLFDVGLGDVFVIRVAGNVVDALELGSIEYAVAHLHVPLVLVMGHEKCGAVSAALSGEVPPGHVLSIVEKIHRNLVGTIPKTGDTVDQAVCVNALATAETIRTSVPILKPIIESGALTVVAARYDLDDGRVTILSK